MAKITVYVALTGLMLTGPVAQAQEGDEELARDMQELKKEMAEVKGELKAVRTQLAQILKEVKNIKAPPARRNPRKPDTKIYTIKTDNAPIRGPKDAPVTITEFACLQCPFCIREAPVIEKMIKAYPDKVRFVFKHFPLAFHKKAKPVHALAAIAFKEKGNEGFWAVYDKVVANPRKLDPPTLRGYAEEIGLDLAKFDAVLADEEAMTALVTPDVTEGKKIGVRGTPTVLINGLKLSPRKEPNYKERIEKLLKDAGAGKEAGPAEGKAFGVLPPKKE
jgi:protein-disulfide isomerase